MLAKYFSCFPVHFICDGRKCLSYKECSTIFQVELEEGELGDDENSGEEEQDDQDSEGELGGSLPGNFLSTLFMGDLRKHTR